MEMNYLMCNDAHYSIIKLFKKGNVFQKNTNRLLLGKCYSMLLKHRELPALIKLNILARKKNKINI